MASPDSRLAVAPAPARWDDETDVAVVGFGGAGACAAIEAAEAGVEVHVIDRFTGGGATAISGGVVYAGGGTEIQAEADVEDTVDDMFAYLREEVGDAVSEATLRRFCEQSASGVDWLRARGVPFRATLCPVKTSYPSDDYHLYYSGNESFAPYREVATPRRVGTGPSAPACPARTSTSRSALRPSAPVRCPCTRLESPA